MIGIDTNILIYAHRSATPQHRAAREAIEKASSDLAVVLLAAAQKLVKKTEAEPSFLWLSTRVGAEVEITDRVWTFSEQLC